MAFNFKTYNATRKTRATATNPAQKAQATAVPTVKASKGQQKSSKTSVKVTHDVKDTAHPKAAKVTKAKLDTTNKTPFNQNKRSARLNYRTLRKRG